MPEKIQCENFLVIKLLLLLYMANRLRRLDNYRKSKVNNIRIEYGGKIIQFNLWDEVAINEVVLNKELKKQSSYYGFLLLLHKRLLTAFETTKQERIRNYAQLYLRGKDKIQKGTNRPYNEEMAKAYADAHKSHKILTLECIKLKDNADVIFACVKAFEQRKDLLQTISSNNRKEIN